MTGTATVTWELPTTRQLGGALPVSAIRGTEVLMSADGGINYVLINEVAPDVPQEVVVSDLDTGTYHFKAICYDTANQAGLESEATGDVADDSPPAAVNNLTVTIT